MTERLEDLFGDLPDAVRVIDARGRVVYRNEASRLLAPDGLGHLCGSDGRERNPSCPACQIDEVLEHGTFLRWHVAVPGERDPPDYYEVTLSPIGHQEGRVGGVLEMLRDATATLGLEQYLIGRAESQEVEIRKRSEEASRLSAELGELRETQTELLERDRLVALNQLVAGISHEIHTPLGAMLSSADLLGRGLKKVNETSRKIEDAKARSSIRNRTRTLEESSRLMVESARRIQAVVRTLQLFSRLDEAAFKKVDLHQGLDTTLELLQYRTGDRIRIHRKYGKLPEVLCRPDALNQVFMNLLLNAVQAIEGKGSIEIRTRQVGAEAWVEIADDGAGISEDQLPRIFDLGFTTKSGAGGAGIGLALTRRIVRDHEGFIEVASRAGEGTTFTLRLPLTEIGDEGK